MDVCFQKRAVQVDMMERNGCNSWLEWDDMYKLYRGGKVVWDDLRYE